MFWYHHHRLVKIYIVSLLLLFMNIRPSSRAYFQKREDSMKKFEEIYPKLYGKFNSFLKEKKETSITITCGELYCCHLLIAMIDEQDCTMFRSEEGLPLNINKSTAKSDSFFISVILAIDARRLLYGIIFSNVQKDGKFEQEEWDDKKRILDINYCVKKYLSISASEDLQRRMMKYSLTGTRAGMKKIYQGLYPFLKAKIFEPWLDALLDKTHPKINRADVVLPIAVVTYFCTIIYLVLRN